MNCTTWTVSADPMLFPTIALTMPLLPCTGSQVQSHQRDGLGGWFHLASDPFSLFYRGKCLWTVRVGPLVPIVLFCLVVLTMMLMHCTGLHVKSQQQDGLQGWFHLASDPFSLYYRGKCHWTVLLGPLVGVFGFCRQLHLPCCSCPVQACKSNLANEMDYGADFTLQVIRSLYFIKVSVFEMYGLNC